MSIDKALQDLISISHSVGQDPRYVQGGGGNTSVKTDDGKRMYIKASGTALKDMSETKGWRRLDIKQVLAILRDRKLGQLDVAEREAKVVALLNLSCDDGLKSNARPSVEAHMHALLSKCVVHLHPVAVDAFVCSKAGRRELERLFASEELPPLWVPYTDPGCSLGAEMYRQISRYRKQHGTTPRIVFLAKHGLLVAADTPDEVLKLTDRVIGACAHVVEKPSGAKVREPDAAAVAQAKLAVRQACFEVTGSYVNVLHLMDSDIAVFLKREDAARLVALPALTPDELVYGHGGPLWVDKADAAVIAKKLRRQRDAGEYVAASFLISGLGLFVTGTESTIPTIRDVALASLQIRSAATDLGGANPLNQRERSFIKNWEAESFRMKVMGGDRSRDLENRIAVVTGAGSGLGRSIAVGLARAGASVVLADIDSAAAEETIGIIRAEILGAPLLVSKCDVTSEQSVVQAYSDIMQRFGGLDIVVNAAGIAPAFPLVDLPVEKWRLALEINLTGYFLMAREAARIMAPQGIGGSIINISSKSGLDASMNNTPYNATKAAELHMARGWALELGKHGIRVNSVAPGNVFEGSKIWNPRYIEECARKYGIKPEEVIPYYVNKTALKREIKGQDVADSVVFLCSDRARTITGQTLVPDGGQVMVR